MLGRPPLVDLYRYFYLANGRARAGDSYLLQRPLRWTKGFRPLTKLEFRLSLLSRFDTVQQPRANVQFLEKLLREVLGSTKTHSCSLHSGVATLAVR